MPDEIDRAQETVAQTILAALGAHVARQQGPGPDIIGGVACCRDCGDPIPPERLAAVPGCGRCVCCQAAHEADG